MVSPEDLQLRDLLIYAGGIYHRSTMIKPYPGWRPCDDIQGMLSQMSNTLRGISDSVNDTQKAADAMSEWLPRAERAEARCRELVVLLREAHRYVSAVIWSGSGGPNKEAIVLSDRINSLLAGRRNP